MKKRLVSISLSSAAAIALVLGIATPASAFGIYEDKDYGGYRYDAIWNVKDGLGSINQKGSSIGGSPGKTFHEGFSYTGRSIYLSGYVSNLQNYSTNLSWGQTWNDRMRSYR